MSWFTDQLSDCRYRHYVVQHVRNFKDKNSKVFYHPYSNPSFDRKLESFHITIPGVLLKPVYFPRPTSGWDRSGSLGHPCKFQRDSRLGSITARHSSIGRQPNFAALNRRCHLYSAGRPSRWALANILVLFASFSCLWYLIVFICMFLAFFATTSWWIKIYIY